MTDTAEPNLEDVAVSKWPTIWKYSLIITACTFAYRLVLYLTGLSGKTGLGLISTVIFIVLLVVAMRKFRILNGGYMDFGTGAVIGIMIGIIESVLFSLLNAVYLAINSSMLAAMSQQAIKTIQANPAMNQQQLDMVSRIYENFVFTPVGIFVIGCITGIIGGIVIALIVAAILKKSPPVTD